MMDWLKIAAVVSAGVAWVTALAFAVASMAQPGTQWWAIGAVLVWVVVTLTTIIWVIDEP